MHRKHNHLRVTNAAGDPGSGSPVSVQGAVSMRFSRLDNSLALRLIAVVLLALAFRVAVFVGRGAGDPGFTNLFIPGNDQTVYVEQGLRIYAGEWVEGAFYFQPGNMLWIAGWLGVTGGDVAAVRVINAILGSLSTLLLFAAGRSALSTRSGLLAATLYALYPVTAFYDSTLLISPVATLFVAIGISSAVIMAQKANMGWVALAGFVLGASVLLRMTLLAMLPGFLLGIWLAPRSVGKRIVYTVSMLGIAAAVVAPISWWNTSQTGEFTLSSTAGSYTLYLGNNRDAGGSNLITQAAEYQHGLGGDYTEALIRDAQAEPWRFVQLQLRKLGLITSSVELPNNFSYADNGLAYAPFLYVSPLRYGRLVLLGLMGAFLVLLNRQWSLTPPVLFAVIYGVGTALIWVNSRVRLPMVPATALLAGVALDVVLSRRAWRAKTGSFLASAGILLALMFTANTLPLPRFQNSAELNEGFSPVDVTFADNLRLIGVRVDTPQTYPDIGMLVTYQWEALQPIEQDIALFLHLWTLGGEQVVAGDVVIGEISYPATPTSQWPVGAVFTEQVMVEVPRDYPTPRGTYLTTGVYDAETGEPLIAVDADGNVLGDTVGLPGLQRIVERWPYPPAPYSESVSVTFGEAFQLTSYEIQPVESAPGTQIVINLTIEVVNPTPFNANYFLHVLNAAGELVTQADGPPLGGGLPTTLWFQGDQWADQIVLGLPPDLPEGEYDLVLGYYDPASGTRLATSGNRPDSFMLGQVIVVE